MSSNEPMGGRARPTRTPRAANSTSTDGSSAPVTREDVQAELAALMILCEALLSEPELPGALRPFGNQLLQGVAHVAALVDHLSEGDV